MQKLKPYFILVIAATLFTSTFGQKAPIKFGKIDIEDLKKEYYELDSSAPAVILCDYGSFSSNTFDFTRILRVKILKKEGYYFANNLFRTNFRTTIKGRTYNLNNGEIEVTKLKPESIYKERLNERYSNMRVAMPNVKEGSIIELQFTFRGLPYKWHFQSEVPVKWSELRLDPTLYVSFRKHFFGHESIDIVENYRWVAIDVPAFKKEPSINSSANYITKFEIEVQEISFPGYYQTYCTTWESVIDHLLNHDRFGEAFIYNSGYLKSLSGSIENLKLDTYNKLISAFDSIKQVKWNERSNIYSNYDYNGQLKFAFKKKVGNSADINLILIQLLKKLKFEVYPVALSTKKNGLLSPIYPSLDKLNYVIAYVKLDNEYIFLDATEELLPIGLLPERCINGKGRIINKNKSDWVNLKSNKKNKQIVYYDLVLNNKTYNFEGNLNCTRSDYAAYKFRKHYETFNSQEEYIYEFAKNHSGLIVHNSIINNIDSIYSPVNDEYELEIENQIINLDNKIMFYPMLVEQLRENPWKLENRKMPIDFSYKKDETCIIKITIPESYSISEIPKSLKMKMPDNSASFMYNVSVLGNIINISSKLNINTEIVTTAEYKNFKEFYNQIVAKHAEPIILKKN